MHSISQHSTAWWSDRKLVGILVGLGAQREIGQIGGILEILARQRFCGAVGS